MDMGGGRKRTRGLDADDGEKNGPVINNINNNNINNNNNKTELSSSTTVRSFLGPDREILTLPDFIAKYAPSLPTLDNNCVDSDRICRTLVSPSKELDPIPGIKTATLSQSLPELIQDIIWSLVQRKSRNWSQQRNVLDQGYVVSDQQRPGANMRAGVVCTHVNDNVTFCKTSSYAETLYKWIGDAMMRLLFLQCSVFLPMTNDGNNNYILLCGTTQSFNNKRRRTMSGRSLLKTSDKANKNKNHKNHKMEQEIWQPNDCIPRHGLFYSHAFVPTVGLHHTHLLNQKDPNKLLSVMVQLYTVEGKKRRKRWKRVRNKGILICQQILQKHEACNYHSILNRHCPLPDFAKKKTRTVVGLAQVGESFTHSDDVTMFLKDTIQCVFPLDFWGSQANLDRALCTIQTLVSLRQHEQLPNKALVEGMKVTEISWLWPSNTKEKSGHEAVTNILQHLMHWIVNDFVIPLLRSLFYVTESEFSSKRMLYYRKPVWAIFRALSITKLTETQYKEITMKETITMLEKQSLGLSSLKLLPKTTGVRPIALLSKPESMLPGQPCRKQSNNAKLAQCLEVFRHEYEQRPELFGAGQTGVEKIYNIIKPFLSRIRTRNNGLKEKLYFVKVDIQKCYDNVNQPYLLRIMEDVLQEDQYVVQRHAVLHPHSSLGRPVWKEVRCVGPLQNYRTFHDLVTTVSDKYQNSIFTNGVGCSVVTKQEVLNTLKEHLERNLVAIPGRYGKRFFQQQTGIPQGSVLSSFLCNFYFGRLEHELLGDLLAPGTLNDALLMRITDDFLLITTDRNKATQFLKRMEEGKPDLGLTINKDKSLTNFGDESHTLEVMSLSGETFFPWCGLLIQTSNGEVQLDYSRFAGQKALDSLTVDRCQTGRNLEIRIKTYLRPRCQPILFDSSINSLRTITLNFVQMILLATVKVHEYVRASAMTIDSNMEFFLKTIDNGILFARSLIMHRLRVQNESACQFHLGEQDVLWIGRSVCQQIFTGLEVPEYERKGKDGTVRLRSAVRKGMHQFFVLTDSKKISSPTSC